MVKLKFGISHRYQFYVNLVKQLVLVIFNSSFDITIN